MTASGVQTVNTGTPSGTIQVDLSSAGVANLIHRSLYPGSQLDQRYNLRGPGTNYIRGDFPHLHDDADLTRLIQNTIRTGRVVYPGIQPRFTDGSVSIYSPLTGASVNIEVATGVIVNVLKPSQGQLRHISRTP